MKKRILSFMICLALVFSIMPVNLLQVQAGLRDDVIVPSLNAGAFFNDVNIVDTTIKGGESATFSVGLPKSGITITGLKWNVVKDRTDYTKLLDETLVNKLFSGINSNTLTIKPFAGNCVLDGAIISLSVTNGEESVELTGSTAKLTVSHTPGDWIVDKAATEKEVGSKHKECTVCGTTVQTEEIEKLACSHSFTEQIKDDKHLVEGSGADCRTPYKYYYDCEYCDVISSEAVWTSDIYGDHDLDANSHCDKCNTTFYGINIGGCKITDKNATDVFGDGKVSYDKTNNTLTLNGYTYSGDGVPFLEDEYAAIVCDKGINIKLVGENTIETSESLNAGGIVLLAGDCTISGTGTLNVIAVGGGIAAAGGSITVKSGKLVLGNGLRPIEVGIMGLGVTIEDGDIAIIADACGMYSMVPSMGITIKGGTVTIATDMEGGPYMVLDYLIGEPVTCTPNFTAYENCKVMASTRVTGSDAVEYDPEDFESYKYVKISLDPSHAEPTTYTVSFDANGGIGTMTAQSGVSGSYTLPACIFIAPSGKQFKAWRVDGVEKAVGDTITVTENTTVTAVWEDKKVYISVSGGTGSGEYSPGEVITISATAYPGSKFKQWSISETMLGAITFVEGTNLTSPTAKFYFTSLVGGRIYAEYEKVDLARIEITTPPNKTVYTVGEYFDPTGMVFTAFYADGSSEEIDCEGYEGYSPDDALSVDDTIITISYTSNEVTKTATVPITVNPIRYTVSFDANGGIGTMTAQSGVLGSYILPTCTFTAPDGKQFKAWSVGGNEKAVGDTINVTENTTVTAVWEDIPAGHTCDIKPVAKVEPDCTTSGKNAYYKCDGCGKFFEDALGTTQIIDFANWGNISELGHDFADATCTDPKTCKRDNCGATEGSAKGHTEVTDKAVSATCEKTGLTAGSHCKDCGAKIKAQTVVKAKGHTTAVKNKKSATYFAKGYSGDTVCTVCNKVVAKGKAIAKKTLKTPKVKVTKGKKQIKVKYTKVSGATGFEVQYKVGKKTVTKSFNTKKSVTRAIKKLKKGSYKVKVRAFVKSGKNKAYSKWTKTKTIKL